MGDVLCTFDAEFIPPLDMEQMSLQTRSQLQDGGLDAYGGATPAPDLV